MRRALVLKARKFERRAKAEPTNARELCQMAREACALARDTAAGLVWRACVQRSPQAS